MLERSRLPTLPTAPKATSPAIRATMQGNRSSNTRPEILLQETLTILGLDWFQLEARLLGSPDIVFEAEKVAIFVHGCYWHRCPYCEPNFPSTNQHYWSAKFARNRARDRRVLKELRKSGWIVIVVWECKLRKNPKRQASPNCQVLIWEQTPMRTVSLFSGCGGSDLGAKEAGADVIFAMDISPNAVKTYENHRDLLASPMCWSSSAMLANWTTCLPATSSWVAIRVKGIAWEGLGPPMPTEKRPFT